MSESDSAFARGNASVEQGDFGRAEQAYAEADEHGHAAAAANLGLLLEHRGQRKKALAAYQRADERGSGLGAFRLGLLLSAREEWPAANEAWARADERGKDQPGPDLEAVLRGGGDRPTSTTAGGGSASAFANPVMVGAVTVLAILVAVFLAYNANAGLPFVPTKELKAEFADGSNLVIGNDVREGGFRVGLVSDMRPIELPSGQVGALLTLKLDKANGNVPVDSTALIRPRSVLGLKFVEIAKGTSSRMFADGGLLKLARTSVPVQFDDIFKTFDSRTRTAIQNDLVGFGDALAGRGSALNDTISGLPGLLARLEPVARYLSDPGTGLTRFFSSLNVFMGTLAPLAQVNARLFADMATTFEAISRDPRALEATIAESPSTLAVSTDSLRAQQPFLVDLKILGQSLGPASGSLVQTLPTINPAIEAGTRTLIRTPSLNRNLQQVLNALKSLALSPGTNIALNALTDTTGTLNPMVRYLGPYVTVCNDWNYWWTYLSEHISEQTSFGFAQRALLNQTNPLQSNGVAAQGATTPVNGGGADLPLGGNAFLHAQPYGAAVSTSGAADCETGQRGYPKKLNYFDPQGRNFATDAHTPGLQGPTFAGQAHVPAGETFSRNPQTGPQLLPNPSNP